MLAIRRTSRFFATATTRRFISASVGKKISTDLEIDELFNSSTWSTSQLLTKEEQPVEISNEILDGLLDLSGLSKTIDPEQRSNYLTSLKQQLNFITKLHNIEVPDNVNNSTQYISRLVDDKSVKPLTYDDLLEAIEQTKPSLSKGEVECSWNPISLTSQHDNEYFLVKEGLLKKNK